MGITNADIKKLWGLSAGRCSYPGCESSCADCVTDEPVIVGEMAHIIAKRPAGPRGVHANGDCSYGNLILLCPTHHRKIDKSPAGMYTKERLFEMKEKHEARVKSALASPTFETIRKLAKYIKNLLIANRTTWETYGPESQQAVANPLSNLAQFWISRRLDVMIPNNRRIINAIQENKTLFDSESYRIACSFIEHAEGFEHSCFSRSEGIPRFPEQFDKMVTAHAEQR